MTLDRAYLPLGLGSVQSSVARGFGSAVMGRACKMKKRPAASAHSMSTGMSNSRSI